MTSRDYDERLDDTDVTDEQVAELNETFASIEAAKEREHDAAKKFYVGRRGKRGSKNVSEASSRMVYSKVRLHPVHKASVAGLAVRLGKITGDQSGAFATAAEILGVQRPDPSPEAMARIRNYRRSGTLSTYTRGQNVRRWVNECSSSNREDVLSAFEAGKNGDTFLGGGDTEADIVYTLKGYASWWCQKLPPFRFRVKKV